MGELVMNKAVLIIGGMGYIGSVLAPYLSSNGYVVNGVDIGYYNPVITAGMGPRGSDFRNLTIDDLKQINNCKAVVHLAALSNDPLGNLNPKLTFEINYKEAVKLAKKAKDAGYRRFVFMSSCSVYGDSADSLVDEESSTNPLTPYAESKLLAEKEILALADNNFWPVALRAGTACGASPMFRNDLVLNQLTSGAVVTGKIKLNSDGSAIRPLVHVKDISKAVLAMLNSPASSISGQVFNVGGYNGNTSILDLANKITEYLPNAEITTNSDNVDKRSYRVDFSKIIRFAKFMPDFWIENAIKDVIDYVVEHDLTLDELNSRKYIRLDQLNYLLGEGYLKSDNLQWCK